MLAWKSDPGLVVRAWATHVTFHTLHSPSPKLRRAERLNLPAIGQVMATARTRPSTRRPLHVAARPDGRGAYGSMPPDGRPGAAADRCGARHCGLAGVGRGHGSFARDPGAHRPPLPATDASHIPPAAVGAGVD